MQFEPHRIVVTKNADLTIRFLDISVQLLIPKPPYPFTSEFPHALPPLSIDVLALVSLPEIAAHLSSGFGEKARIIDVQLAVESLEVGLVLSGGEVLVYRMADRQGVTARQLPDKRLVSLEHVPVADGLRFKPHFLITAESPVTAFAISDVGEHSSRTYKLFFPYVVSLGFASVAYANGSVIVIDMRGPRVILQVEKAQQTTNHGFLHRNSPGAHPVLSLAWAISGIKSGKFSLPLYPRSILKCRRFVDATPRIRLVAARASGQVQIYILARDDKGIWSIPSAPSEVEGVPAPLNSGMFVLDVNTGEPCKADKSHLTVALDFKPSPKAPEEGARCLLLIIGAKGARCLADFGNERVARVEWDKIGNVVRAQVVERNGILSFDSMSFALRQSVLPGSYALVVFTDKHDGLVYSLPMLEHLHTLPLPTASSM